MLSFVKYDRPAAEFIWDQNYYLRRTLQDLGRRFDKEVAPLNGHAAEAGRWAGGLLQPVPRDRPRPELLVQAISPTSDYYKGLVRTDFLWSVVFHSRVPKKKH